jgi:hypothetical protein
MIIIHLNITMGVNFDESLSLVSLCIVLTQEFQKYRGQKEHNKICCIHPEIDKRLSEEKNCSTSTHLTRNLE